MSGNGGEGRDGVKDRVIDQSGILAVKTGSLKLYDGRRRPKLFRPPLSWTLWLLAGSLALASGALYHRRSLDRRSAEIFSQHRGAPFEIQKLRQDLSDLELDEASLSRELDARLDYIGNLENDEFFLVVDTHAKRFFLRLGDTVLRESPLEVGPPRQFTPKRGERRSLPPLTGAFSVRGKALDAAWKAPEWAYEAAGRRPPKPLPSIPRGLGKYVIELSEGYVIHSPPSPASPLKGPKPGSFLVQEADLAAVWPRIGPKTRVYVF